ncbi:MAG: hypothetical protein JXB39_15220, partial [Deltaproteobacteria bacterium]|nr:hypothetical protein [Deltaproteobacteria bacterium]
LSSAHASFTAENPDNEIGRSLASGDVDGDLTDDLLISDYVDDEATDSAGAVYLVYGVGL